MSTRPSLDIACAQVSVCFAAGGFAYASALLWVGVAKGGTCPPWVSWVFPSQDGRSYSLLPRFPPTRLARRARMQPCISFAELSRPSIGRPGGGRGTLDMRPFCVCLGPLGQAVGPGF